MKNLVSIFAGHDANISFWDAKTNKYYTIEIERLLKKRYFRLHQDHNMLEQNAILAECRDIAWRQWGIENNYEAVLVSSDGFLNTDPRIVFNTDNLKTVASHHQTHVVAAYHLSPFKEALIVSYDGGGDDGHFLVYTASDDHIQPIDKIPSDFGGGYLLCGYGNVIPEFVPAFEEFFFDRDYEKLSNWTNLPLKNIKNPWGDLYENPASNWVFEGQEGYDIAATAQEAFENAFFSVLDKYDQDIPLIMTGGCALNVLVNEKVKERYDRPLYVPPQPHDGSLSLGHMFVYRPPTERVDITYAGLPLIDRDKLESLGGKKVNKKEIAQLIKDGKILGLVYGDSEVGPRALGNRSIVCDPNIADMKDILNSKVKFREWYRPFAPFCKKEEAYKWFESKNFENLEYMSYAPKVKEEYRDKLPSITHVDGTARLQTVTEESHSHFYELLTEFGKISETNVLLNTSFNIRGFPILSTIDDAFYALNNTDMDYVVIEDYLFGKSEVQ